MFKKILFVFVLAVAVLTFAGYSVPTASACSALNADDCRPIFTSAPQSLSSDTHNAMFGPNFVTVQPVPAPSTGMVGDSSYQLPASVRDIGESRLESGPTIEDPTFNSLSLQ